MGWRNNKQLLKKWGEKFGLKEAFFFKKLKEKERSNVYVFKENASHVLA